VNIPLTDDLLVSAGGGYTYRGPYNREGAIDPVTLVLLLRMEPICIPSRTKPPGLLDWTIMRLRLRTAISYFRTQIDSSSTLN
jgi:hypothetical protein